MSTSDAGGAQELRARGGEAASPPSRTPRASRSSAARAQWDETFGATFQWENHHGDETSTSQGPHISAIRQEAPHRALIFGVVGVSGKEAAHRAGSEVQTRESSCARFTSSFSLTLSRNLSYDRPEVTLKPRPDSSSASFTEEQRAETQVNCWQVNRPTSPPEERSTPATREEVTFVCNELANSGFGPHKHNGLLTLPFGAPPKRTGSGSVKLEQDIKDHTRFENQNYLEGLSTSAETMLSSSVVTVLAPNWSGRLRRNKRFEGSGNSDAQGDVTNTAENHTHECFQVTQNQNSVERVRTDRSQSQLRDSFLVTRRNTVDWSTKSGPARLDYGSKRKMNQTISLDVNSGRMDNRKLDSGALSLVAMPASPRSSLSFDTNDQRNPQTGHQGALSGPSSKPTTSSLLLSLRSGRSSNAISTLSDEHCFPSDQKGNLYATHLSQSFLSNDQERSKSLLSPSSGSYRITENRPVLSQSSSNHREMKISESCFFSTSPINKNTEDTPFKQQQPQTVNMTPSSLTCSNQTFLSRGSPERQQNSWALGKNTNLLFPESAVSFSRHSSYDPSALLKTQSLPRRATLTSTSWWKQVTVEGSSPLTLSDTTNIKDQQDTVDQSVPCNDNSDFSFPRPADNKRFSCQIPSNIENNNTTESVCRGNMNLVTKTPGGTPNFKQRHAEDSPDHKQQCGSNLNNKDPHKPHNMPSVLSKIGRVTAQTTLSHPKDSSKCGAINSSSTANMTELPPSLLNPKNSDTLMESSCKYRDNHCSSKITPAPHSKDSKQSYSLATTIALNSQALTSKTTSGLHPVSNTNVSSSSDSYSSPSKTHTVSPTGSASQSRKYTSTANTTPLGFERSYASIPKPVYSKTVSGLIPTVSAHSKTNYSPVSTASISVSTTGSHPAATTAPSLSRFSPPAIPDITLSPTALTLSSLPTPPATPIITSPNYSESYGTKEERTFASSPERDPKKLRTRVPEKRVRRVTWEDSADLQHSEAITKEKLDPSGAPTSPLSPSRSPQCVRAPSIFSFLRSTSPTTNTSPLCSPTPKTSSIQVRNGGKYRSLSSDCADLTPKERDRPKERPSNVIFDQVKQDITAPRQERTLSVESGTAQYSLSAPPSLPPDFSSGYKLRYSSPPYSTLMSSRSTQGETKTIKVRPPLFQQATQSMYAPHLSLHADQGAALTVPAPKPPLSPISPTQTLFLPFQNKTTMQENSKCGVSETDQINNNHRQNNSQEHQNAQISLVDNRIHVSSHCLQDDKAHSTSSTCVTETLVYSIKSKAATYTTAPNNGTTKPLQHNENTAVSLVTKLSQQPHTVISKSKSKEAPGEPRRHSDQSSSGGSSAESQGDKGCNRKTKDSVLGKSRFFSVESSSEQSPKKSRFTLKKSVSTPNSSLSRSDSERISKPNNKMDQVLNRLRQTFSTRRSDDDVSFPWKWKRPFQTPSVGESSTAADMIEKQEQVTGVQLKDKEKEIEGTEGWTQNRYTIIPPSDAGSTMTGDQFSIWSDQSTPDSHYDDQKSGSKAQLHLTAHSPTMHQLEFYKDDKTDHNPTNQFPSCKDPSPGRSPNPSGGYPAQFRKSTSSPRSPFSPFSSLSPLSPFSSPDATDDSVFYSPKLQRRRESSSPCEPGEGISLGGSRRSRVSTGPPSVDPGQGKERMASSYADLKYGIEPGRSFSVSSVLSSRPSGPGRISTGSRFMSVGDLSESSLTCGDTGKYMDQWSCTPSWTTSYDCQPPSDHRVPCFPSDKGKMRSRSLPRSLTRCLANWSSGVPVSQPVISIASNPAPHWSGWDTEGPPTPPPTPPQSPGSRRMSKPPSLSSTTFPTLPGAPQSVDNQSSRGHLPSRGYISSLSTFEESSDSSSDTTTDDEYYLETGEGEEKETEL